MKKLLTILMIAACMVGCTETTEKPFIIHSTDWCNEGEKVYRYHGSNNMYGAFVDSCNKYQIGDTIK